MPINIPDTLPATKTLEQENIFYMSEDRAAHQDIRPLKIVILNLMPKKIETETQLLRLLSNSPLQIDIELLQTASHTPKHTPPEHLIKFYKVFDEIKDQKFDGMIVTGAPVEQLDFEDVDYWPELCKIMDWAKSNVFSSFYICWAAQAALYYHYQIPKYPLHQKMFGIFKHEILHQNHPLIRGFDERFMAPHSRHTEVRSEDIVKHEQLLLLASSKAAGPYIVSSADGREIFVTGHAEYDTDTLAKEYFRDVDKGLPIEIPANYFPDNNPSIPPINLWKGHAHLLFSNWLNYFVYQNTPYDLSLL